MMMMIVSKLPKLYMLRRNTYLMCCRSCVPSDTNTASNTEYVFVSVKKVNWTAKHGRKIVFNDVIMLHGLAADRNKAWCQLLFLEVKTYM